jgi:hypothetical protein
MQKKVQGNMKNRSKLLKLTGKVILEISAGCEKNKYGHLHATNWLWTSACPTQRNKDTETH